MGLLDKALKKRARYKAEIKAAEKRAAGEVKSAAKADHRRAKLLAKQERELLKAERKGLKAKRKHEKQMAEKKLAQLKAGKFNKDNVKRWTGAARLLAPLAIPAIYRLVTSGKEKLNEQRAQKFGITPDQMAQFSGYGAPLKARIEGIRRSLKRDSIAPGLRRDVEDRLDELSAAVDNAEYMTDEQRRRAHSSIERDIDQVTNQLQESIQR